MSPFSRSVSSSIVFRNSLRASGLHSMSSWRRLVTEALMAEIGVRRSWETADRMAARSSLAAEAAPAASTSACRSPSSTEAVSSFRNASRMRSSSLRRGRPASARTCSSSRSIVREADSGLSGARRPPDASIRHCSPLRCSTAAPSRPRTLTRLSTTTAAGAEPARRASASASARVCAASAVRRAASATKPLTIAATAMNTDRARMFSPSLIVNV